MIKTLLFDFGDVFINLDKEASGIEMKKLGIQVWNISPKKEDIVDLFKINTHLIA